MTELGSEGPVCSGLLLAEPNAVGEEVLLTQSMDVSVQKHLFRTEQTGRGGEWTWKEKQTALECYLLCHTGLSGYKKQIHSWSPPREKPGMGRNLKGRNALGCGVHEDLL